MKETQPVTSVGASIAPIETDKCESVHSELLDPNAQIPLLVRPLRYDTDLVSWASERIEVIESQLIRYRAVLFRGFPVKTPAYFHSFVEASSTGPLLEYKDRSTPRYEVGQHIYVSTIYPSEQRIHPHNEGTYWKVWPRKIYFCCLKAAPKGGETPIVDVRRVCDRIDSGIREVFRQKQVMYVRNYNPGVGLTWQDAFQTKDPEAVMDYAAKNGIDVEWTKNGRLRTRQVRPAIRKHPVTGEDLWFNHAAFFHVSSLDPEIREVLLESYGEEGLPYNTYFGDGSHIDPAVIAHIRAAYAAEKIIFTWHDGDIMLLDNMSIAHAREPYSGPRNVIVAMTEAQSDERS